MAEPPSRPFGSISGPVDLSSSSSVANPDEIVGDCPQILELKAFSDRVAASDAAILITGETGTGKELFAQRIHQVSKRRHRPLISVNCAAIPDELLESELFGYEKGAFTGAAKQHYGQFMQANGGTIFLDEIGDLSLSAQAKLLRVLETKEVRRLGSAQGQKIDIRVVAATNRNLSRMRGEGKFRDDLLFRIGVVEIDVPPLRGRNNDILLIADHLLKTLSLRDRRPGATLTDTAKTYLKSQSWPGNVRELKNLMERALLLCESNLITEEHLVRMSRQSSCAAHFRLASALTDSYAPSSMVTAANQHHESECPRMTTFSSKRVERDLLFRTLQEVNWNKSRAAKLLQCSRMTVHRKVVQFHLERPAAVTQ